ncbi:Uncharacterized protein TPAR_08639 [Tolypocladium paradoxum]|uniref:Uncharacterized protein n=1 Tax=Tolypocladium paradoxum TaxID=94208 RepID=A0A2S4KLS3_9HYPO|nr:Uncharacterized protein TPAR_08639 [Tolypocladium paradoxum]
MAETTTEAGAKPPHSCTAIPTIPLAPTVARTALSAFVVGVSDSDTARIRGLATHLHGIESPAYLLLSVPFGSSLAAGKSGQGFSRDQPWVKIKRVLSFVDETIDVVNIHDSGTTNLADEDFDRPSSPRQSSADPASSPASWLHPDSTTESARPRSESSSSLQNHGYPHKRRTWSHGTSSDIRSVHSVAHSQFSQPAALGFDSQSVGDEYIPTCAESPVVEPHVPSVSTRDGLGFPDVVESPLNGAASTIGNPASDSLPNIYLETPQWPIRDAQEAMLFRYFVQELAQLFDLCDNERHFARVVPRRAVFCPPLMNAMLAASAKRLSRVSDFDRTVVDQYHQKCLDVLIPALSNSAAVMDENLLPAIVILRFMEELDVPIATAAPESHLIGTRVFVAAQEEMCGFTSLWRAAFWLALRQEIHMAFIQTRPVHSNFTLENAERLIQPDDNGCSFANLLIVQCALCIRYCYGSDIQSMAAWEGLKEAQDRLWEERPWMFYPMYGDDSSAEPFPVEQYLNDAVVTGIQHYYLTRILMAAHNPKAPKLGPGQAGAARETNREIKRIVRQICGIAESNPRTAPAYVFVLVSVLRLLTLGTNNCGPRNACIAITMAGDRFTGRHEQEAFYMILVKTDTELAWPTRSAVLRVIFRQLRMKEAWGWSTLPSRPGMPIEIMLDNSMRLPLSEPATLDVVVVDSAGDITVAERG